MRFIVIVCVCNCGFWLCDRLCWNFVIISLLVCLWNEICLIFFCVIILFCMSLSVFLIVLLCVVMMWWLLFISVMIFMFFGVLKVKLIFNLGLMCLLFLFVFGVGFWIIWLLGNLLLRSFLNVLWLMFFLRLSAVVLFLFYLFWWFFFV